MLVHALSLSLKTIKKPKVRKVFSGLFKPIQIHTGSKTQHCHLTPPSLLMFNHQVLSLLFPQYLLIHPLAPIQISTPSTLSKSLNLPSVSQHSKKQTKTKLVLALSSKRGTKKIKASAGAGECQCWYTEPEGLWEIRQSLVSVAKADTGEWPEWVQGWWSRTWEAESKLATTVPLMKKLAQVIKAQMVGQGIVLQNQILS